jgi:hypothetical protein
MTVLDGDNTTSELLQEFCPDRQIGKLVINAENSRFLPITASARIHWGIPRGGQRWRNFAF